MTSYRTYLDSGRLQSSNIMGSSVTDHDFDGTGGTMVGSCIVCCLVYARLSRLFEVRGTPMERLEQTLASRALDHGITHR